MAINFGVMIGKLKRQKVMEDIMHEGHRRNRWVDIARDPKALSRELATMEEASRAASLSLEHLRNNEASGRGVRVAG